MKDVGKCLAVVLDKDREESAFVYAVHLAPITHGPTKKLQLM